MRLILKISRNELRNLFYSPVAWFLAVAFWVQCALAYTAKITQYADYQDMSLENNPNFEGFTASLTKIIFSADEGIFYSVVSNLYLFLPLLTMGIISREINDGTIKLLYSSPIKPRHIVLGKFLAIVFYNLLLLGIVGLFMVSGLLSIQHVDTGMVLSALLAIFLLICAYSAIGIFFSSLTTYQIVSAVGTFLVILILGKMSFVWQEYDVIRDFTYFLSTQTRTTKMISGLITTNDVIYFLLMIFMFLSFTLLRVRSAMESKAWYINAIQYLAVFSSVMVLGYISSKQKNIGYWDTTRDNIHTIHANTQEVISDFEAAEPLEITLYVNLLDRSFDRGAPFNRKDFEVRLWERYLRFKPDIKFNYIYYYDVLDGDNSLFATYPNKGLKEIAEMFSGPMKMNFSKLKSPQEVKKEVDLQPEGKRVIMQATYKGRKTFIRTFDDGEFWPNEMNIAGAFKLLQMEDSPTVYYTTGNLERSIYKTGEREFRYQTLNTLNRGSLINLGFKVDSLNLDTEDIPLNTAVLIIADPKTAISEGKRLKINNFIENGGNAAFLSEPKKQGILNPLLNDLGLHLNPGILVEVTKEEMPDRVKPFLTREAIYLSDQFAPEQAILAEGKTPRNLIGMMPGVVEIVEIDSSHAFQKVPFFVTVKPRNTFSRTGILVLDSVPPVFDPAYGDTRKDSYVTLMGLKRQKENREQRLWVAGDADFMSNIREGGAALQVALLSWLDNNRFPVYIPQITPIDTMLTVTYAVAKTQTFVFVWLIPGLIVLFGAVLLIRRKRK